uniref:Cytochrome c oxidase assembly factor 1 n=1 Tax=Sciurus vulgaris TaxID=55149 RepID=A0A8D2AV79_SCIVU
MPEPLGKMFLYTSVLMAGTCPLFYYLVQKGFARTSFYQMALEQLHSHPEALEALGTPLHVHYLQLPSKHNFVDITVAWLKIPVSGSKSEGHVYTRSTRVAPFQRWQLQEVVLELKDGQKIPLFMVSEKNGDIVNE